MFNLHIPSLVEHQTKRNKKLSKINAYYIYNDVITTKQSRDLQFKHQRDKTISDIDDHNKIISEDDSCFIAYLVILVQKPAESTIRGN